MKTEDHMQSAAAFVEGGIQEACDDACSICLEAFCESDPSTLTSCKHEFHLQCILEWRQRSSNCPMCWQAISLKEPFSQELLEAVERERSIRSTPFRTSEIFHHPTLGDFELQHLPVGASDAELKEWIFQHLAAASAMGRARQIAWREGPRSRSSAHGRPQLMVFTSHPGAGSISSSLFPSGEESEPRAISIARASVPLTDGDEQMADYAIPHSGQNSASASGSPTVTANQQGTYVNNRYKETISKSTRGWRERLFSRNSSMDGLTPESRRDSNSGISNIFHRIEGLRAAREDRGADLASPVVVADASVTEKLYLNNEEIHHLGAMRNESNAGARTTGSVSN